MKECKLCSNNDFHKHSSYTMLEQKSQTVQLCLENDFGLL